MNKSGRGRRAAVRGLLPYLFISSSTLVLATLILFSVYAKLATDLLAQKTQDVLEASTTLFSRLQLASLPSFINLLDDADVKDFLVNTKGNTLTAFKALTKIDQLVLAFDFLDSIYLSSPFNGVLSTRNGWERLTTESDPDLRSVIDASRHFPSYRYINRRVSVSGGPAVPLWTLVLRASNTGQTGDVPSLVFNIASDKVRRQVETSQESDGDSLVILSNSGNILTSRDPTSVGQSFEQYFGIQSQALLKDAIGTSSVQQSGVPKMLSWVTQPELGWKFLVFTDEEKFLAPVKEIRNEAIILGSTLTMVSAALMLWIFLWQGRAHRKSEMILNFLSGTMESKDVPEISRFLKQEGPWTGMILRIDGHAALRDIEKSHAQDALEELVSRNIDRRKICVGYRDWGLIVLVDAKTNPASAVLEKWKVLKPVLQQSVSVRVSSQPVSFKEIVERFSSLEQAFGVFFLFPHGSLTLFEPGESRTQESTAFRVADADLDRYEQALRHAETTGLSELFDHLEDQLKGCGTDSPFHFLVQSLAYRALRVLGTQFEFAIGKSRSWFEQEVDRIETFRQLRELFEDLVLTLERRPVSSPGKHQLVVRRVKELVALHLDDRTFGTAKLADETGFSVSYLRELFKQTEGHSLMSYISQARLEEAKRLLGETSLQVAEICDKTGFLNTSYFFTYFKKWEGLTPIEFRIRAADRSQ